MKLALIGLGGQTIGDHLPAISNLASGRVTISSIVEANPQRLERYKQELAVPGFSTVEEMLEHAVPDVAIVAVPHAAYPDIMRKLLEAGVSVLKEKPMAVSLEEGRQIVAMTEDSHGQVVIACQKRFRQSTQLFEQIREQIGTIRFVQANYLIANHTRYGSWRGRRSIAGGGCLLDMGYHLIDLLVWYFGLPEKVSAFGGSPATDAEVEDVSALLAHYEKANFICSCLISDCAQNKSEFIEVTGSTGIIRIEKELATIQTNTNAGVATYRFKSRDCALAQLENFLAIVAGDAENLSTPAAHLSHLAFIDAAYRSMTTRIAQSPLSIV